LLISGTSARLQSERSTFSHAQPFVASNMLTKVGWEQTLPIAINKKVTEWTLRIMKAQLPRAFATIKGVLVLDGKSSLRTFRDACKNTREMV
jgi:hypothetical protein